MLAPGARVLLRRTLSPGDPVLLVFCERDFGQWWDSGQLSNPQSTGLHSINGAVALPGLTPRINPIPVPSDAAALASKLDAFLRAVSALADSTTPATAVAAAQGVILAARGVVGGSAGVPGTGTTGSSVLKLGS